MIRWLLEEPRHAPANDVFDAVAAEKIAVPSNWIIEIGNALRRACLTKRISPKEVSGLAGKLAVFDPDRIPDLVSLALKLDLAVYDSGYIGLVLERRSPLATVDGAMRAAAKRMNVPLLPA
jgi:predicted nucleic acid-binding protein